MAAIFALVFVFILAAALFMIGGLFGGLSIASIAAVAIFIALASGVFIGLLRMMKHWETDEIHRV